MIIFFFNRNCGFLLFLESDIFDTFGISLFKLVIHRPNFSFKILLFSTLLGIISPVFTLISLLKDFSVDGANLGEL